MCGVLCERCCREEEEGGRRRRSEEVHQKNKNLTRQCGEKLSRLTHSRHTCMVLIDTRLFVDNEPVYHSVWLPVTSLEILSFCGSRGQAVLEPSPQSKEHSCRLPPVGGGIWPCRNRACSQCIAALHVLAPLFLAGVDLKSSSADTVVFPEPQVH